MEAMQHIQAKFFLIISDHKHYSWTKFCPNRWWSPQIFVEIIWNDPFATGRRRREVDVWGANHSTKACLNSRPLIALSVPDDGIPINLHAGDIVILREDNTTPLKWPLGRVVLVHTGQDGLVRVVNVKTATGTYRRPITKVVLLPTGCNDNWFKHLFIVTPYFLYHM